MSEIQKSWSDTPTPMVPAPSDYVLSEKLLASFTADVQADSRRIANLAAGEFADEIDHV